MPSMTDTAHDFFVACDTGKGWEACAPFCTPDATFAAQAEPLMEITTLRDYAEWMKGLMTVLTDGSYQVKSFGVDTHRNNVSIYGVFTGTHLAGGPVPPTGKTIQTDYVYTIQFEGGKIVHMTKIWNAGLALKGLGWT